MRLLAHFLLVIVCAYGQRSQFEVDCPEACICNKTTIGCTRSHARGSNIFLAMRPEAYPDLDTIIATGNSVGDIADSNLFGADATHQKVSLVNLSNNEISAFDSSSFQGLPALEYFYLAENEVLKIGADPFRWNTKLRVLDISNLFATSLALVDRPILMQKMFSKSANNFVNLQELIARDNSLTSISPETFCSIEGLLRLHLSGNELTEFTFDDGCLPNLQFLELSNNRIVTVGMRIWDGLPALSAVDISSNPLRCDCEISPFVKKLAASASSSVNQGHTICDSPPSRKGQNVFNVIDFGCSSHRSYILFFLVIALLCSAFILFRRYRSRLRFSLHLPFVAGYSKLGGNEATAAQFV